MDALNCFLRDIYGKKQILKDGIIPEAFVFSAKGYLPPCDGVVPPKGIYSHISGIDLVQSKDDNWYILEDNLRVPSGASYPMIAREFQRKSAPAAFLHNSVIDNRNYAQMLKSVMDNVNTGGINVILSPGRYNAAFFEHSYLAERTGAVLTTGSDLVCENDNLYYVDYEGRKRRVGAVYRRISDEYLDPMTFYEDSVIGIPHVFENHLNAYIYAPVEAWLRNCTEILKMDEKTARKMIREVDRSRGLLPIGSGIPFYSMLAVLWCIQPYTTSTLAMVKQRTIGTFLGAAYGLVFLLFFRTFGGGNKAVVYLTACAMLVPILYTTVLLEKRNASYFSCVVFLTIAINSAHHRQLPNYPCKEQCCPGMSIPLHIGYC